MKLAPVVLFTYQRLDTLQQTVEALKLNYLAAESDLYIYSDAAKGVDDQEAIDCVRDYIKSIHGFKTITIHESDSNKGLASSIIEGVNDILKIHGAVIVVEDDLVSSPNFLNYMNASLHFYKEESKVFSIAGYSLPIKNCQSKFDVYFTSRSSSWGWATWKDRWEGIDWEVKDYSSFKNSSIVRQNFNKMGSDMAQMLDRQMNGKINSWAIRWCYHQFKNNLYSVHPFVSKIDNVGFNSKDATNTNERFNRYKTKIDDSGKIEFYFTKYLKLDKKILKQYTYPYSILSRIKYKIINFTSKN
jgi:hypothetical protein